MDIKYTIEFFSYWHCGSGLSAGADVDLLTIKDEHYLPYVPGKTLKGLIREAAENLSSFNPEEYASSDELCIVFGKTPNDKYTQGSADNTVGCAFFSNAELPDIDKATFGRLYEEYKAKIDKQNDETKKRIDIWKIVSSYLYERINSTAIDEKGIAKEHSLRRIEVALPCVLTGTILNLPDNNVKIQHTLKDSLKFIKRLGENRNRGLGRCRFTIINE